MNLIIDYGNTSAKVGLFDQHVLKEKHTFSTTEQLTYFLQHSPADYCIISSVSAEASQIASHTKEVKKIFVLNHTLPLPIINRYATPTTLGVDRLAGVCGASSLYPGEHALVIDAGTCITFDFIDHDKNYLGGAISPGLTMRFKAVHTFTSRLPLVEPTDDAALIGNSTQTCIQSGVINGMVAETDGIVARYQRKYNNLRVILCGGDAAFLGDKLSTSIVITPDLVLTGLNSILMHNLQL